MQGQFCRVVPLEPERHPADLYAANNEDREGRMWTYLAYGPLSSFEDYFAMLNEWHLMEGRHIQAILGEPNGLDSGLASYMHIEPRHGSIEVGAVMYSPHLQRTRTATEAMYLLMRRAFDELGCRSMSGNAMHSMRLRLTRRSVWGFNLKGSFGKRPLSRATTGTLRGSLSSTATGHRSRRLLKRGLGPATLIRMEDNADP
jgi:hypothetical protein